MKYNGTIKTFLPITSNPIINIIDGKIDFCEKKCLDMKSRIEIFKYFLLKLYITKNNDEKTLKNGREILLHTLLENRLYIFRKGDLNNDYLTIIIKLLRDISIKDLENINVKTNHKDITKIMHLFIKISNGTIDNTNKNKRINDKKVV